MQGALMKIPEFVDICVKGDDDGPPVTMKVMCAKVGSPLYVELTADNLSFLATTVAAQYKNGSIHRKRPRDVRPMTDNVDVGVPGAFFAHTAKRVVMRVKDDPPCQQDDSVGNHKAQRKWKTVSTKQLSIQEALAQAKEIADRVKVGLDITNGNDDEAEMDSVL